MPISPSTAERPSVAGDPQALILGLTHVVRIAAAGQGRGPITCETGHHAAADPSSVPA